MSDTAIMVCCFIVCMTVVAVKVIDVTSKMPELNNKSIIPMTRLEDDENA